jgi:hypothetical protein
MPRSFRKKKKKIVRIDSRCVEEQIEVALNVRTAIHCLTKGIYAPCVVRKLWTVQEFFEYEKRVSLLQHLEHGNISKLQSDFKRWIPNKRARIRLLRMMLRYICIFGQKKLSISKVFQTIEVIKNLAVLHVGDINNVFPVFDWMFCFVILKKYHPQSPIHYGLITEVFDACARSNHPDAWFAAVRRGLNIRLKTFQDAVGLVCYFDLWKLYPGVFPLPEASKSIESMIASTKPSLRLPALKHLVSMAPVIVPCMKAEQWNMWLTPNLFFYILSADWQCISQCIDLIESINQNPYAKAWVPPWSEFKVDIAKFIITTILIDIPRFRHDSSTLALLYSQTKRLIPCSIARGSYTMDLSSSVWSKEPTTGALKRTQGYWSDFCLEMIDASGLVERMRGTVTWIDTITNQEEKRAYLLQLVPAVLYVTTYISIFPSKAAQVTNDDQLIRSQLSHFLSGRITFKDIHAAMLSLPPTYRSSASVLSFMFSRIYFPEVITPARVIYMCSTLSCYCALTWQWITHMVERVEAHMPLCGHVDAAIAPMLSVKHIGTTTAALHHLWATMVCARSVMSKELAQYALYPIMDVILQSASASWLRARCTFYALLIIGLDILQFATDDVTTAHISSYGPFACIDSLLATPRERDKDLSEEQAKYKKLLCRLYNEVSVSKVQRSLEFIVSRAELQSLYFRHALPATVHSIEVSDKHHMSATLSEGKDRPVMVLLKIIRHGLCTWARRS